MSPPHTQLFEDATAVTPLSSHEYSANLHPHWAIGAVPHGGYTMSILYRLATTHFKHTHPTRHNSDPMPIAMHMSFLRRAVVGPAILTVEDAKLGTRTSTIHVTLSQDGRGRDDGGKSERVVKVVGYITVSDPVADVGVSRKSAWGLYPPAPRGRPVGIEDPRSIGVGVGVDVGAGGGSGSSGGGGMWKITAPNKYSNFRKVEHQTITFGPVARDDERRGRLGICDQWTRLNTKDLDRQSVRGGGVGKWTNEAAVFLSDWYPTALDGLRGRALSSSSSADKDGGRPPFWFPTVVLNIDFKKRLPPEGVDWLYSRIVTKAVRNGRMDMEVIVMDEEGDIILLSSQVGLVVSFDRNTSDVSDVSKASL